MQQSTATTWVKVYSVIYWIEAIIIATAGLAMLFGGTFMAGMMSWMMADVDALTGSVIGGALSVLGVVLIAVAVLYAFIGRAVWRHESWGRIAAIVLSALGLFSFPIGTALGIFGIYLFGFEPNTRALFGVGTASKPAIVTSVPSKKAAKKKK